MQGGPFAGGYGGGDLSICQFLSEQGKADVDVAELKADVAGADKGVEAAAAKEKHIDVYRGGGFVDAGGGGYVGKGDGAGFLFKAEAAGDFYQAEGVDVKVAGGTGQDAFAGVKVHGQAARGGDGAGVDGKVLSFVVGQRAVGGGTVDFNFKGVGGYGQVGYTNKGGTAGAGLQGGPFAQGVAGCFKPGALLAGQGKAEFYVAEV